MKIGICDDELNIRHEIANICNCYAQNNGLAIELYEFTDGLEVLNTDIHLDLLFLDIEMRNCDGITIMRNLINSEKVWRIVFVSSHDELVMQVFGVKTLAFVRKPFSQYDIINWLAVVIKELGQDYLVELEEKSNATLRISDIIFIESHGNYSDIITKDNTYSTRRTLQKWEKLLYNGNFLRIHKSFIVNMDHISRIGSEVEMKNGAVLTISRSYKKSSIDEYNNYVLKKMRERR